MNFRESTQADMDYMAVNTASRGIFKKQPDQIYYCYTLEHEGEPLGVGGFNLINSTTAWCWVDMANSSHKHIIATYRVIKEWIDIFVKEHGIKRLQAYVEVDFTEAIVMVGHLGFHYESTMENFVGDKPALMYVKFMGDK